MDHTAHAEMVGTAHCGREADDIPEAVRIGVRLNVDFRNPWAEIALAVVVRVVFALPRVMSDALLRRLEACRSQEGGEQHRADQPASISNHDTLLLLNVS
jgi:hypothetical protein